MAKIMGFPLDLPSGTDQFRPRPARQSRVVSLQYTEV